MMQLVIEFSPSPVTQGSSVSGRVLLDLGADDLVACDLLVRFPLQALTGLVIQGDGFSQAGDDFEAPVAADGTCAVAAIPATPLAGTVTLLSFQAQVTGLRGELYPLTAEMLSVTTSDMRLLSAEPVETTFLVASGAPGVATHVLPDAHAGEYYAAPVIAEGGQPPYQFSLTTGGMPGGLAFHGSGFVTGTPTQAADATFTVQVRDSATPPATATRDLALHVTAPPPRIQTNALPRTAPGHPFDVTLTAAGGRAPLVWQVSGLPAGLQLQGGRINGTVDPGSPLGTATVHVTVTDAEPNHQTDEADLQLEITTAIPVQRVPIASPGVVVAARDLYVAEYYIEVSGSASSTYRDEATDEILDRAIEETLTEIFEEWQGGRWPGEPEPGSPGRDPGNIDPVPDDGTGRPPRETNRLDELLQQWRWLDDQRDPNVVRFGVIIDVNIDGRHAHTWSNVKLDRLQRRGRKASRRQESTAEQRRRMDSLRKDGRKWMAYAGERLKKAMRGESDTAEKKKPQKEMFKLWDSPERAFFDERLERLLDFVKGRDWNLWWPDPDAKRLTLTPGRHRVRVTPTILQAMVGESVSGAMEMASAQAAMKVTFKAHNPANWPRLRGELIVQGTCRRGEYFEEDVEFPQSAIDIVCESNGELQLIPYSGKPEKLYASPRPFAIGAGIVASHLTARAVDEIGRTWLGASDGVNVVVARNKGIGGFARLSLPLMPNLDAGVQGFSAVEMTGWGAFVVLHGRQVVVYHNLHKAEAEPAVAVDRTVLERAFLSGVARDTGAALNVVLHADQWRLVIADRFSGQLTSAVLDVSAPETPAAFVAGYDEVRPMSDVRSIAFDDAGAEPRGVAALKSQRRIEWFRLMGAAAAAPTGPAQVVELAAHPSAIVMGPGAGVTILLEPAGQTLYARSVDGALHALDLDGGITAVDCRETVLVCSRKAVNELVITIDRRS